MLSALGDEIYTATHPLVMPGGIALGMRMTVVRLGDGGLFLHSPIPLSGELRRELDALGTPRALVAPNRMHWLHLAEAA